jgi:nicotinate-nucleotide pyrophosphorylase (carboxylating)
MKPSLFETAATVRRALEEDIGHRDVTTHAVIPEGVLCRGTILAKQAGVICGVEVAGLCFRALDASARYEPAFEDGQRVAAGQKLASVEGPARAILTAERTALNFLQRMSGIATATAAYVEAIHGTKAQILDTRKTAPGLRALDKYAVRVGGGRNHRFNLSDGILIKENHLALAGGVGPAVAAARRGAHPGLKVAVEAQSLAQVREAVEAGADGILLDNMDLDTLRQAVTVVAGRATTEASGGVTLETVLAIAQTGVDFISVGALTHSVRALDLSLEVEPHRDPGPAGAQGSLGPAA